MGDQPTNCSTGRRRIAVVLDRGERAEPFREPDTKLVREIPIVSAGIHGRGAQGAQQRILRIDRGVARIAVFLEKDDQVTGNGIFGADFSEAPLPWILNELRAIARSEVGIVI